MVTARIAPIALVLLNLCLNTAAAASQESPGQDSAEPQITVPEGTVLPIVLTAYLSTRNSQAGDIAYAETIYPIWIQQRLVIPKGSMIRGTITEVIRAGKVKGKGRLAVRFDDILLPNGVKRDIIASLRGIHGPGDEKVDRNSESVSTDGSAADDAETVVATTSQGAVIGAIAGRGTGAAIGAGAGAAAGIVTMLFTRERDLVLSPGTQFDLELRRPVKFAYNEIDFTNAQLNSVQRPIQPLQAPQPPARRRPYGGIWWPFF